MLLFKMHIHFLPKSQEYFDKRREAFAYQGKCAKMLLNSWVATYGSTENCPISHFQIWKRKLPTKSLYDN
jgi:hypothetical protein